MGVLVDTPQQRAILRQSAAARKARARFPEGTRVDSGAAHGTVVRHVPGNNAQGGTIVVRWDNGTIGRHSAIMLTVIEEGA